MESEPREVSNEEWNDLLFEYIKSLPEEDQAELAWELRGECDELHCECEYLWLDRSKEGCRLLWVLDGNEEEGSGIHFQRYETAYQAIEDREWPDEVWEMWANDRNALNRDYPNVYQLTEYMDQFKHCDF
jgi:hypothetical protein